MQEVRRRLLIFLILFIIITISGTIAFMFLEDISFAEAFYYNIVTMSTVGYGDIHPTTQAGRMFAVVLIVLGGAIFLGVIANITEIFILRREIKNRVKKVNMVLGVFFSEVGLKLLAVFSDHDHNINRLRKYLIIKAEWNEIMFFKAVKAAKTYQYEVDASDLDIPYLGDFLNSKRDLLLNFLENPAFVEHENFSDALLSVFHLQDELSSRNRLTDLSSGDISHISVDINRVYKMLIEQWILYMKHLKKEYPYLFSLAMRKNPFDPDAKPSF